MLAKGDAEFIVNAMNKSGERLNLTWDLITSNWLEWAVTVHR